MCIKDNYKNQNKILTNYKTYKQIKCRSLARKKKKHDLVGTVPQRQK